MSTASSEGLASWVCKSCDFKGPSRELARTEGGHRLICPRCRSDVRLLPAPAPRAAPTSPAPPEGREEGEPQARDHAANDKLAKELAMDALQSIADSEPDEDTDGAQEVLASTPYAHMYVLNGSVIEDAFEHVLSNAFYDGVIQRAPAAAPVEAGERNAVEAITATIEDFCTGIGRRMRWVHARQLAAQMVVRHGTLGAQPPASPTPDARQRLDKIADIIDGVHNRCGGDLEENMWSHIGEEMMSTELQAIYALASDAEGFTASGAASPVTGERERMDRGRAVEGGHVQPPDLATFLRAAEEDRCAYCGIVDPEVDGQGHCASCGGWLPPAEALTGEGDGRERVAPVSEGAEIYLMSHIEELEQDATELAHQAPFQAQALRFIAEAARAALRPSPEGSRVPDAGETAYG